MEDLSGKQLGPYQVVAPVGEGGIATVYKAYQPGEERYVALKILPRHLVDDAGFAAQFEQVAETVVGLEHPHILPVFDYGQSDGYAYLAMPFIQHGDLAGLLETGPLTLSEVRRIISQLGGALDYAHQRGLLHQGVKPRNVLLDQQGDCLLMDFGLAAIVAESESVVALGGVIGTPSYLSPEQGERRQVDQRSDVYALGIILYELVTGRVPYRAESPLAVVMKHVNDPLPSPRRFAPELPEAVERVIFKSLAKQPEDRYDTAREIVRAVEGAIPAPSLDVTPERIQTDLETPTPSNELDVPMPLANKNRSSSTGKIWLLTMAGIFGGLFCGLVLIGWLLYSVIGTLPPPTNVSSTVVSSFQSTTTVLPTFTREPTRRPATVTPTSASLPVAETSTTDGIELSNEAQATPVEIVSQEGSDWACLGFFGFGVTCLGESGWQSFTQENSPLGGDLVQTMTACPDGRILMSHTFGISAFDGAEWAEYESGWGVSTVDALACDVEGGIWAAHFEGVSYFRNGEWRTYPATDFVASDGNQSLVDDIAISPEGQVWVVTANSVARLEDEQWRVFQEGDGFSDQHFFDQITFDKADMPWVVHSGGIFSFDETTWSGYGNRNIYLSESIGVDADNRIWVGTFSQGVHIFNNRAWQTYDTKNSDLSSDHIRQIITDTQGRIWLATSWGLTVIDGEVWHRYHMHNTDIADNDIHALAVVGSGPTLLEAVEKEVGLLKGRIVDRSGQPIANKALVLCVERFSDNFSGTTPCDEQPLFIKSVTDESGNFIFADLLPGRYRLVANAPANSWTLLTESAGLISERILVEADQEVDLLQLILTPEE